MKKTIYGILITSLVLMFSQLFAQQGFDTNLLKTKTQLKQLDKKTIKLDLSIIVDNQIIEDTTYQMDIVNYNTGKLTSFNVPNKVILYLDYSNQYEISVCYKNTNTKAIIVDTDAPFDNYYIITGISLVSNSNSRILAGGIKYDNIKNTFVKYINGR